MGGADTHAVARVLATNHRAPPVSVAQAASGDDHRPLGGGTNAGRELERQRDSRGCPARVRGFCGPVRRRYCRRPGGPRAARGHPTGRPSAAGWHTLRQTPRFVYERIYCARGDIENRIKELLDSLQIDRTSYCRFWANQLRVLLTAAAYVLLQELRLRAARTACARAQVTWLRRRRSELRG